MTFGKNEDDYIIFFIKYAFGKERYRGNWNKNVSIYFKDGNKVYSYKSDKEELVITKSPGGDFTIEGTERLVEMADQFEV